MWPSRRNLLIGVSVGKHDLLEPIDRGVGANPEMEAAAWLILEPGLTGRTSPILRETHTWTARNARKLREAITGDNADMGGRSFLEKLYDQLSSLDDASIVLATELLYVHVAPLKNLRAETKIKRIETVLSWVNGDVPLPDLLRQGLEAGGTFNSGAGFNVRIWEQFVWLTHFVEAWSSAEPEERSAALQNPWTFRDFIFAVEGPPEQAMRMSLLILIWPGYFDSVARTKHRRKIRDAFAREIGAEAGDPSADVDRDLWEIRKKIQVPGQPRFNWYASPFYDQWSAGSAATNGNRAWLIRPGSGGAELIECWVAEGFISLPATTLSLDLTAPTEQSIRDGVDIGYAHLDYVQRLQLMQAAESFILRMESDDFVLTLFEDKVQLGIVSGEPEWVETDGARLQRKVDWLQTTLVKDDLPESVSGAFDKRGDIVDLSTAWDELQEIAGNLTSSTDEEVSVDEIGHRTRSAIEIPDASDELAAQLHMPKSVLQEWLDVLSERRQLVFYGPPGTGKTFIAETIGRHIVGSETNRVRTVQFHPSYAYEDFFEGLRPVVTDGQVSYEIVPGPLRNLVAEASTPGNESMSYVLIIDEMNRANLAKVFGELYYLLEYRDQSINLQYSNDNDFRLPRNFFVIGTMNTLDRSISMVDAALRRRFPFIELHPMTEPVSMVLRTYLETKGVDDEGARLLDALNAGIDERDLHIGPSYLMKESAREEGGLHRIWKYDILPLLEDHFYGMRTPEQVHARFGLEALRAEIQKEFVDSANPFLGVEGEATSMEPSDERESSDS